MTFSYYCEYFPRIGAVAVTFTKIDSPEVWLISPTLLGVQSSMSSLPQIQYEIPLPVPVDHPYNKISKDYLKNEDSHFELRLRCSNIDKVDRSTNHFIKNFKWTAVQLNQLRLKKFSFNCSSCDTPIMNSSDINKFRDLPSEYWSEMLEFWVCHRPSVAGTAAVEPHSSAIASMTVNKPSEKTVCVGSCYFLVRDKDFADKMIVDSENLDFEKGTAMVECGNCSHQLGVLEFKTSVKRINKWSLSLSLLESSRKEIFHAYSAAYSAILDYVNTEASRMFKISSRSKKVYLWLLNSGISASIPGLGVVSECLKVKYCFELDSEVEVIEIDEEVIDSLVDVLKKSSEGVLGQLDRGSWQVGIIPGDFGDLR